MSKIGPTEVPGRDPHRVSAIDSHWTRRRASFVRWGVVGVALGVAGYLLLGALGALPEIFSDGAAGFVLAAAAGGVMGEIGALLRNAFATLYLRFIWTRLNHHEASDLLDRMS